MYTEEGDSGQIVVSSANVAQASWLSEPSFVFVMLIRAIRLRLNKELFRSSSKNIVDHCISTFRKLKPFSILKFE
jgi:hypothetical protein